MGVYIPNLEMPTSCFDCPVAHPALGNLGGAILGCPLIGKTLSAPFCEEKRMDYCPLIPVPPHGRLIDADALWDVAYKAWGTEYDPWVCNLFMEMINNAPTIIPASKEEEG